ncbi:ceramide kinase isoform X3 [Caloenas nicobarica]|uniref:ceramide kinase isoform X3 n=1 Tax=Caloenas nicobarica TaxID=187106 RepID=UPI0032B7A51F
MEQLPGGRRPRLVSSLGLGQRCCEVTLDEARGGIAWRDPRPPRRGSGNCFVPTSEIIAVEETELNKKQRNIGKWRKMAKPHAFTVYYVKKARNHHWRCSDVTFWCADEHLCNQWIQALKELLETQKSRPKQLLVYINPYGGKRQGKRIYEQKVAPLFSLASISTDVVITEHANHAKDNLFEVNINKYDGVVCVGGDGMFSEVMHGLIGRMQKDSGIDQNNPKAPLVQCNIRIGIIPAGSTDCICYSTVGISDPVTSALHIIVGDCQPLDVSSVHHNNTFLKYSVSLLGYGFYGDILKDSEKKRWMGPMRYDYSEDEEGWKVIKGKFLAINAVNMSCACPRSPKGLSPAAHLADGSADLILVRKCSRFDFLRYLVRHTNQDDQFDFSFVDVYRVKSFQFTSKLSDDNESSVTDIGKKRFGQFCRDHPACCCNIPNSTWNCDGETLDSSAIEVRVHCQLMKLFARGIEENCKDEAACSQSSVQQLL